MITTGMLKRHVWMADNEFNHIIKNSQRALGLNDQYKNHLYVEEFTKTCNVMFAYETYVLEGEADATFSLPNNNFCSQMINCMKGWNYLQKTPYLPLNTKSINQAHGLMMEDEKDILVGNIESPLYL